MKTIELLVVDDHNLFRRGLIALLSQDERFHVMGEAGDIGEALRCVQRSRPDLILLDNHLPGVRGVDGIATLKDAAPGTSVLMLTVSENEDDLAAALRAGADGYLLKTVESDQLCDSIVKVLAGESVVSPEMMTKLVTAFRSNAAVPVVAQGPAAVVPA
ncbi:MAG: response regulator, partial [Rhodoferax sp.]